MEKQDKIKRKVNIIFVLVFAMLIILPGILLDSRSSISEEEHRYLTEFPAIVNEDGRLNDEWKEGFAGYLYDRLGLRAQFISTAAVTKLDILRMTPSDIIHVGKDGWYFYAFQNGIDIGRGEYYLSEEYLNILLENHQAISEYYASKGCEYYFMPLPGKPSIYPEYLNVGNFTLGETVIDQFTTTLNEQSSVNVIEVKESFVNNKDKGHIFLKQDFHVNTFGSYLAYECILKEMNKTGFMNGALPIPIVVEDANYGPGEVSGYMGNILFDEYSPNVLFTMHSQQVTSGEYFDSVNKICEEALTPNRILNLDIGIFENPGAEYGTLLIYGDSQTMLERKLPQYLAEHFKTVIRVGNKPDIYEPLDNFVKPDVVIIESIERQISKTYTVPKQ